MQSVTPRSDGYGDVTATLYPHVYTLSISTCKNQSTKVCGALYILTYEYNYKVFTRYDKYYKNTTSLIGANAKI